MARSATESYLQDPLRIFDDFVRTLDNRLDKNVREHLKNVYSSLALCLLAASFGAYIHVFTDILRGNFLTSLAAIIVLLVLYATPDNGSNEKLRLGYLLGFAGLSGLGLGPLLDVAMVINPSTVVTAFFGTCVIFGCFTLAALYAPDRKYLYLGGLLLSGLTTMIWMSIFNLFIGSSFIYHLNLYAGLLVMSGFVLYDTQVIMFKRQMGDNDYIWQSVDLFIDFINIFRHLLVILMNKEQRKERKRN